MSKMQLANRTVQFEFSVDFLDFRKQYYEHEAAMEVQMSPRETICAC